MPGMTGMIHHNNALISNSFSLLQSNSNAMLPGTKNSNSRYHGKDAVQYSEGDFETER